MIVVCQNPEDFPRLKCKVVGKTSKNGETSMLSEVWYCVVTSNLNIIRILLLKGLLKQITGPHCHRFWFRRLGWGPRICLTHSQGLLLRSDPSLRTTGIVGRRGSNDFEPCLCPPVPSPVFWSHQDLYKNFHFNKFLRSFVYILNLRTTDLISLLISLIYKQE